MKEFIDKLIERLEESKERYEDVAFFEMNTNGHTLDFEYSNGKKDGVSEAIEIVNELAEEYNNESVKGDLISRSAVIRELNGIYLDNPYDDKEDILEKAIGIVDHFPAPYTEGE